MAGFGNALYRESMNVFAKLLLGDEASRALDLLAGEGSGKDDHDQLSRGDQVRRSGAWCGSTPDSLGPIIVSGRRAR